jgi:hypothetical protein
MMSCVDRRLWGSTRYLYRQRLPPPIQERRELSKNESMVLVTASAIRDDDQDLSLHTFSYLAIHALVHTRLTPFVIFHALIVKFFLCFASDIRGLYPIMGELDPNAMNFYTRVTAIKYRFRLHTTFSDREEHRGSR